MSIYRLLIGGTLSLCLLLGEMAWGISGPQVAQLLNTRYANDTVRCVGDMDSYYCSGELRVTNWNEQAPESLPVQALYYERSWPLALLAAQRVSGDGGMAANSAPGSG